MSTDLLITIFSIIYFVLVTLLGLAAIWQTARGREVLMVLLISSLGTAIIVCYIAATYKIYNLIFGG